MYAVTSTLIQCGFELRKIEVECHLSSGLPSFQISGLPGTAIKEARDRVRSALKISGFDFPRRRITVNLAPAHIPKIGTHLDLAIAMSILKASNQIQSTFAPEHIVLGELNLQGSFKFSTTLLSIILAAAHQEYNYKFLIPAELSEQLSDIPIQATLLQNLKCLSKHHHKTHKPKINSDNKIQTTINSNIFSDVIGQYSARRALQICLAGNHHLLFVGPPGCGKSFIADKLKDIPQKLSIKESWQSKRLYYMSGLESQFSNKRLPVRSPHHSASLKGIVGGGRPIYPGEVSLAHRGFLILDELPEFRRNVLESLRQIMQSYKVHISHGFERALIPAVNTVLGTMNPCPCGYYDSQLHFATCKCLPQQVQLYQSRVSGPLLDRFAMSICMHLEDEHSKRLDLIGIDNFWSNIALARTIQLERYATSFDQKSVFSKYFNGQVTEDIFQKFTGLKPGVFKKPEKLIISNRKHSQLLRIAQTIADMQDTPVTQDHFEEALFLQQFNTQKTFGVKKI